jgi:uncharacterized membrane protein YfcA
MLLGVLLGAIVGLILALTGAGGGILAVPLLVFALDLPMQAAAPVGLLAVGLAAAVGALLGLHEGKVRYRAAALIGVAGMALAPVGVWVGRRVPNAPLLCGFALVLAYVAWRMLRQSTRRAGAGTDTRPPRQPSCVVNPASGRLLWTAPCAGALAATGIVSGLLTGLFGVGGGFVIVPSLTRNTDLDALSITGTSLAVIALVSVSGVVAATWSGTMAWSVALPFGAGAVAALLIGRRLARHVAGARLQQGFAALSAAVSVLLLLRAVGWIGA